MAFAPDPRLDDAKAIPIMDVAERLGIDGDLRRAGREWVGPCPRPGCGGQDRFSIAPDKDVFHCRSCGGDGCGADGIGLVRMVRGLPFPEALTWLVGDKRATPEEQAQIKARAKARRKSQDADADRRRRRAIAEARDIWSAGRDPAGTPVAEYLARRGLPPSVTDYLPESLRFHPELPYMMPDGRGGWACVHRGPAMLAACITPDRTLTAVHRTWLDLSEPKGKLVLRNPDGAPRMASDGKPPPTKKLWGRKSACAIRLSEPTGFKTLVMGEGIETTLTAMAAAGHDADTGSAYWAGIDLGHMSGRRMLRGKGMKYAGVPDMGDADGFVPPPWVTTFVVIRDGDSEPRSTHAKLLSCLARAKAHIPGLRTQMIDPGAGVDLNDLAMGVT